jgi:hypothetical protein
MILKNFILKLNRFLNQGAHAHKSKPTRTGKADFPHKQMSSPLRKSARVASREPRAVDRVARASVRKGPSRIHGQGAFASRRIVAGTSVVSMQQAAQARDGAPPGYPHDSVIHLAKGGIMVRDMGWTSPHHKPAWYVLNHSAAGANVAARASGSGGYVSLDWVALRDIERGEELLWRYQTGRALTF